MWPVLCILMTYRVTCGEFGDARARFTTTALWEAEFHSMEAERLLSGSHKHRCL